MAAMGLMSVVGIGPAVAGNSAGANGSTSCATVNLMENSNSTFTYHRVSLVSPNHNAVAWVLNNRVAPTDLTVQYDSTPDSATDAVYYDADYTTFCGRTWHGSGGSVVGMVQCSSLAGQHCNRMNVHFDNSATDAYSTTKARVLACHETGHSIGVKHASGSTCMNSTISSFQTWYSTHERTDIVNHVW